MCNMWGDDINSKAEQLLQPKLDLEIKKIKIDFQEKQPIFSGSDFNQNVNELQNEQIIDFKNEILKLKNEIESKCKLIQELLL